jgi:hypothetical protein
MNEPHHIRDILPGVMSEIERHARQSEIHRRGVLAALKGFRGPVPELVEQAERAQATEPGQPESKTAALLRGTT